jgi:hypothetical protein
MKNSVFALLLAFVFAFSSINIFAGDIPHVGKTCPPNTTCLEGDIPNGGKTCPPNTTCLVNDESILETVLGYLARLFG